MKIYILLIILFFISILSQAQDSVYVRGLYINKFNKREVLAKRQNIPIDTNVQTFFFSLQINSKDIFYCKNEINYLLANPYLKNTEIYLTPPFDDYFSKIMRDRNITVHNYNKSLENNYYIMENDDVHLFQIFYIEGEALRVKVDCDYLIPASSLQFGFQYNIPLPIINRTLTSICCYLFYDIDNVTQYDISDKFQLYRQ